MGLKKLQFQNIRPTKSTWVKVALIGLYKAIKPLLILGLAALWPREQLLQPGSSHKPHEKLSLQQTPRQKE